MNNKWIKITSTIIGFLFLLSALLVVFIVEENKVLLITTLSGVGSGLIAYKTKTYNKIIEKIK